MLWKTFNNMNWNTRYATEHYGKCWTGYHQCGMKKKNGREVPNCVPDDEDE